MYNSILILDDSLTQTKKDVIYALKKTNVLVLEFNYASKNYEDLKNELNDIYQEREVLGDDLELQNILFLNTKFEHTNVFQSYLNNNKGFLLNVEVNDPNYNSWSKLTDLIDYCKSSFSLEHFDFLDVNHLYYSESWSHVFQHIHNHCDLSNSFMKVNYLSKSIIMDETNTNTLNTSNNWLKTLLNDFSDLNEDIMNLMNLYFTKNNEDSNNLLNSSTLFNIDSSATLCNNYSLNSYISNKIRVLIIPCLQQNNNEQFALLVKQLNGSSQNEILPIFLNDDESFESFSQKFVTLYNSFVSNIDTSNEHEIYMGIYLPPYWNDQPNPSNSISLSNQLQTISLELNNNQPSSGSIFSGIIQLIKTQYTYVSKLYFEFFNLTQNYSNNLNVIYKNLSTQEGFAGFVGFYFSYVTHLDKYHNIYKPEQDHIEIYNPYVNNMIYYDSGTDSYYYEESRHNIEYFLNLENNANFKTRDFIENVKIHNIILYNEELDGNLDEIQESLTPNTLLLKFSPDTTTYESMKQQLLSLNEESNVDIKNVALFQHAYESSNIFIFLQDQDHTFYDVSNSDPELTTWSKFTEFTLFLQNELHVSNFDLLMCQIYSDPTWVYILNKLESQLTSLNIRSSDDNTGHVMFDGDWVLESENVDVNMVYLYFNEKVLDVELVLTNLGNSQTIVISKDRRSLYCTGRSIDSTMTYSESSRASGAYFSKISFYNNSVDSRYNILDSDEYIKTVNYNQGIMILTTKNKLYGVGKNNNSSLATGNGTTYNYPVECLFKDGDVLSSKNVIQIVFTGFNFFVLMDDGTVYGAGSGGDNMLTPNYSTHQNKFVQCHQGGLQTGETYTAITALNRGLMLTTSNNRVLQVGRGGSGSARGHTGNKTTKTIGECLFTDSLLTNETIIKLLNINLNTGLYTNLGNIYMAGYNNKLHFGSGFSLNTHYPRFVRTSVSSIDGTIERLWQTNALTIWVYTSTNKYFVRGANDGNYNQALMNHRNNVGDWTEPDLDVYETFNDSHVLQFFDRGFHSKACINEKGEVFVWGNSGNWAYATSGTNRSGTQININPPEQVYTSSTSSSSNYLTDVIYGPAFETIYFKDDFNLEIMKTGSLTGSSSYNIPLISSFNSATDASSNTVLHFDSDSSYSDVSYALTTGIYKITNVPSNTPLALINNGQTDHIVYGGTTTESNSYGPNNSNYYNYVSGTMYIEVDSSFDPIGFYTTANSGSYLGTQGDLTYSAEAIEYSNVSVDSASASANILASSSYFNIFKDASSNYLGILSDNDEISGNVYNNYKFINYTTYQITNIPEQYKLAIVEVSSNDVTITGDTNKKSSHNIDGVAHDFYYGDISINASYGFNTLKMYVYNGLKSSVVELQNNITFELPNVSLVQNEASRKVLTKDVFLKVYKNSATEYLIHFNENDELSGNFYDTYSIEDAGIYKFKSIPTRYLFGIKVNDNASSIEISGNDSNKSTYSAGGGNVDFYHGDLYVKINDLSYNISTYIYDTSTSTSVRVGSDSNEFIDFANFGISGPTPVFMTLNVSEKFDTYGVFNIVNIDPSFSSQPYDDSREFGVYKNQTYVINAPTVFPLALVGRLDQSDISYGGYSENQDGTTNIGGTDYPLYHGPVFFTINDDLNANNTLSFYTKNQYNLNTTGSIVYDASSEFSLDLSTNHYVENEDTYNIEMMINSVVSETTPAITTNHLVSRFVSPNKINKNTTFYKNEKLVVYKNSVYNINQIPSWYPITILNNGITNKITLSGDANKKITQDVSGTSYDFYYGDISFSLLDSISDLSGVTLYSSYGGGTLVNNEHMIIMKEDSSLNEPLQQFMSMKIYTNGNGDPIYQLNDKSAILSNYKFGAHVGTYIIKDVPEAYSMAVINNDISDVVTYSGTSTKGNYTGPDSIEYPFYYGTVTMTIKAFNEDIDGSYISLYSYNNGYMGAQNIIEISSNQVYNVMDQDLYLHGAGSSSVDTSITLEESETAMLEIEYIATTENETEATWSANYVKEGSNGSTSLTNSATGFQYNSDDNGPYFLVNNHTNVTLQTYPNQSYLFNMDSTSGAVLCYEIWCYYSGNDGTITSKGWLMGVETGWGPYIVLTDTRIGGIGTTPGAGDNNTYSSLTSPGYITNSTNKGQLLHIVGYWEQISSSNHNRGVYINGTHYPQETTSQSGRTNFPGFDSFNSGSPYFQIGGRGDTSHTALGVRVYSFRIWHGDIRSKISTLYDAGPHANINTGSSSSASSSPSLTYFTPLSYQISAPTSSISLTDSETAMLQTEFIAKTENATVSTWSANYVKAGSNGSTSLTNSNTMFQYNSDTTGPYFLVNSNTSIVTLQNYPNQSYLLNMDSTSGAVLCYEMWCYYSGDDGTMGLGWALGIETDWGPYISLNTSNMGGIGATPAANDNNTYSSLTSPGYITDTANKGQLLHIVAYWEQTATNNHNRGVYINGTHYPQETTNQSGYGGKPGFDSITNNFQVGAKGTGGNHAIGLRIYSFRIWHGDIRSKVSTLYDAGAHAYVYTDSLDVTIENPTTYQNIDVSMTKYSYFTEKLPTSTSSSTYTDASGCKAIMLNGETTYDANKVYSVYDGTYTVTATSANAFAIINTDSSGTHPLVITGGTIETTKNSLYNTEISYNYYSGDVTFKVLGYFNNVVLIEHIDGSSNSQYTRIKYDETANPGVYTESSGDGGGGSTTTTECLDISSSISVADGKYLLNGNSSYDENRNFGVYIGSYEIYSVPSSHPLAILNNDVSNNVTYNGTTLEGNQEVDGVSYNYYSGKLTLTIQNDFTSDLSALSLHCLNHGYMGGQNKIVFTSDCSGSVPAEQEQEEESVNKTCLRTNTTISIPASITSTNGIILNYGYVNTYDSTLLYGLDIGSYIITDIPPQTPLAIFNHDVSSSLEYTGETLQLSMFNPNQSREYNYYSGYVRMIVKSIPSDVSYVSFGIFKNKEFHDETNKFIFDSACSTDDYYYDCIDTHSLIELSGNVIHVNETSYETGSKKLALYNGYVEFRHVPEDNPIAFISASNSNDISYQGLAYNKQTLTINSQNVDFYHGNVVLRILNDFDNDLVLHMKQTDSTTTSTLNLYYSDYCDYKASSNSLLPYVECLAFDNCMNFINLLNHRHLGFNLDTDDVISTQRMYGFNVGLYKFNNISEDDAIRITNISNGDVFLSSDEFIEIQGVNDTSDNIYYYGDVFLHVTTDVSYLSLGNSNGIEFTTTSNAKFIGKDRLFYSTECLTDDSFYIDCLKQTSDISVNSGNLLLNGETSYSSTTKYGLYLGNYVVNNIPSGHPLALLNNDISNLVTYSGSTLESTTNVDGVPYNFYSGSMYITVKGDFNSLDPSGLSLYCSNHGYMGAENIFKYSELCSTIGEGYYIEDLSNTMTFNKVDDKILLNNESSYDEYKKYGLYVGTYTISNVPEEDALAITNKDFLSKIAYTGTQLKGKASIDDVSYSFYYGTVSIYVFEPFDNIKNSYPPVSELSFYSYTNGYLGGLEKLVYYDIPRNYSTLNYTICLNEQSVIKIFNVDNSDNYTFNDSATYYDYKQYGMHIGKYILKDVPMSEPIALLNQDVSNVIVYNGKSNKKVVANDPSGNSRDFFFGNVEIEVTGDFGNLSVYSANGKYLGGENILTFTDFCETNGYVIECLELESSMNIYNNNFTLNNASSYNQYKKYGLTTGSYRITNIPSSQALTFINNDLSDVVIVTGDSVDLCGNFTGPDGNNYNFYTNELNLTIKDEFTGFLPLYSYSDLSHNNGAELFVYSDLCTSINAPQTFIHCLNNENTNDISLASNDSTKLLLDSGLVNHNSSLKYGVYTGNYIFDVPSSHPIAFLNVDVSNHVSYFGNEENKSLGSAPKGNENIEYEFYHGRVILNVFGNFNTLSYYIKDDNDPSGGSYMGGLNAIQYSDFCDDQASTTGISCLTTSSSFNLIENGGSYVYTLNGDSSIVNNRNYGVHENIYTLTDICENYPIAILNNGIEEKISYGGADTDLCGNFTAPDGNNYDFYKNQITISVSDSSFNSLSFYVYNPPNSGYFGLQNKLVYSDLCEDTLAETDEVVEDILTTSFDKQAS